MRANGSVDRYCRDVGDHVRFARKFELGKHSFLEHVCIFCILSARNERTSRVGLLCAFLNVFLIRWSSEMFVYLKHATFFA